MNSKTGLVLEGGGMRCAFTAGVLDSFISAGRSFDYVIGVSAGASCGMSYVSGQFERNRKVFVDGHHNYRYFSLLNAIKTGNMLDADLLFRRYPDDLIPFDYEAFENSPAEFRICMTDCITGLPFYAGSRDFSREDYMRKVLAASNSLPFISPAVDIDGTPYLDGGLSDSIPAEKAAADRCGLIVVILTRPAGYRKKPSGLSLPLKLAYRKYPMLIKALETRHNNYNRQLDYCEKLESEGKAQIIRPAETFGVARTESDTAKLERLYLHGRETGESFLKGLFPNQSHRTAQTGSSI